MAPATAVRSIRAVSRSAGAGILTTGPPGRQALDLDSLDTESVRHPITVRESGEKRGGNEDVLGAHTEAALGLSQKPAAVAKQLENPLRGKSLARWFDLTAPRLCRIDAGLGEVVPRLARVVEALVSWPASARLPVPMTAPAAPASTPRTLPLPVPAVSRAVGGSGGVGPALRMGAMNFSRPPRLIGPRPTATISISFSQGFLPFRMQGQVRPQPV